MGVAGFALSQPSKPPILLAQYNLIYSPALYTDKNGYRMNRVLSLLTLISLFIPLAAGHAQTGKDDIAADSSIKAVTVYSDRARITRTATVDVPAGMHTVTFKGLPAELLPDSLRAEGQARAPVKFGAVTSKQIVSAQLAAAPENELNDKVLALQSQIAAVNAEKAAIAAQEKFFGTIGQQATLRNNENIAQLDLKPEQWTAAAQAIRNGLSEAGKAQLAQDQKLRDLNLELTKTRTTLAMLATDQRSTYVVSVPLEAETATHLTIDLTYQVPNATWKPLYDARLSTEGGQGSLKLSQYGAVSQKTGEDWTGVALTLSTAQPQRGTSLPDLQPMWVDVFEPVPPGGRSSLPMQAKAAMPQYSAALSSVVNSSVANANVGPIDNFEAAPPTPPVEVKAAFVTAQIETGGFISEYKIPGPSTVPTDGTETRLMVGDFDVASSLEVQVKPQLSTDAFLVAKAKLKGDNPILPGRVNLFRDGAFVGQSAIKLLRPDEETDFYFGVDDQISVKRKVLKDEKSQQGVITRDSVLEHDYSTEIMNLHKTPTHVVVKETIPAPRNDKITVDLVRQATTDGYKDNADDIKGMLEWDFDLPPKAKKDLKLGWVLSWPKDEEISGIR